MKLQLGDNWRAVLRHAHSVRWMALSFACEVAAIVLHTTGAFSQSYRAAMALQLAGAVCGLAAFAARLTKQRSLP